MALRSLRRLLFDAARRFLAPPGLRARLWAAGCRLSRRCVRALLGPADEHAPLAAGPEEVFLVVPGRVTTLLPLSPRLRLRRLDAPLPHSSSQVGAPPTEPPITPPGDFGSEAERRRLAELPPIDARALDQVDWDALARALTRGS